tara:strand:- start:827 stop:1183 length:357 start_codon:yes stop_codon:yes gene_type:complete
MYNGTITSDGNCKITMPKLKGLIEEGGNLKLEVIADDMYFNPWESEYDILISKKVTVEVKDQPKEPIVESRIKVKVVSEEVRGVRPSVVESKEVTPRKTQRIKSTLTKSDIQEILKRL